MPIKSFVQLVASQASRKFTSQARTIATQAKPLVTFLGIGENHCDPSPYSLAKVTLQKLKEHQIPHAYCFEYSSGTNPVTIHQSLTYTLIM